MILVKEVSDNDVHEINSREHMNPQLTRSVSGFIAQLVRASHRYRKFTGSNPVEVMNFFQASLRYCIKLRS